VNVLLIGPPGAGKGTQGERLAQRLGLIHIAAGDLLREEVKADSAVGRDVKAYIDRGDLVPDSVILEMVVPRVTEAAAGPGYVLDGFPRSVAQAQEARELARRAGAAPDVVLYLDVPREELVRRILARAAEQGRSDDNPQTIRNRLEVFDQVTKPLIEYYRGRGLLKVIDADRDPDAVTEEILSALDAAR
jgi:adenylate kinase